MAYAAAIAAIAGAAVSAYGMYRQGQYQKDAAQYNAKIAERDAEMARRKAEYDAQTSAEKYKVLMGKQRALYAKAGVDITSGSPLLTMSYQAEQAERDRLAILYSGKTAAESDLDRARLFRFTGENAETSSYYSAGSTLLSSLANTYSSSSRNRSTYLDD